MFAGGCVIRERMMFDARSITVKPCGVRNVAENYLAELCRYYDCMVLVNEDMADQLNVDARATLIPSKISRFSILSDIWITYLIVRYRPSIFFSAHSFLPVAALLPKRKIFICHDLFAALDPSFFSKYGSFSFVPRVLFRFLSEVSFFRASLIISPSREIKKSYDQLFLKAKNVHVIHNGVSVKKLTTDFSDKKKEILFVGNFRQYKGFDILFQAWSSICKLESTRHWRLNVVTNENLSSIREFVTNKGGGVAESLFLLPS